MIEINEITLAYLQIHNETLACDFSTFHKAVEEVLHRPVWTHQFGSREVLKQKGMYDKSSTTLDLSREDIMDLIDQKFKEYCEQKHTDIRKGK